MTAADNTDPKPADAALDPKEAMRLALEKKKEAEHASAAHGINADRSQGHAQGPVGGKRQFRRKSGG